MMRDDVIFGHLLATSITTAGLGLRRFRSDTRYCPAPLPGGLTEADKRALLAAHEKRRRKARKKGEPA